MLGARAQRHTTLVAVQHKVRSVPGDMPVVSAWDHAARLLNARLLNLSCMAPAGPQKHVANATTCAGPRFWNRCRGKAQLACTARTTCCSGRAPPPPNLFVRRAQEALSVARVRGNGYVWKQGLQAMAYGGGRCFQTGLDRPTEEVG